MDEKIKALTNARTQIRIAEDAIKAAREILGAAELMLHLGSDLSDAAGDLQQMSVAMTMALSTLRRSAGAR